MIADFLCAPLGLVVALFYAILFMYLVSRKPLKL